MYAKKLHQASWLSLSLLILCGVTYATPIGIEQNQPADLLASADHSNPPVTLANASATVKAASQSAVNTEGLSQTSPELCVLTGTCSTPTVKVAEPQSLILMGSGLLSMAGLIRRRVIRR